MSVIKPKLFLSALGIINALGNGKDEVLRNLQAGSQAGIVTRSDMLVGGDCECIVGAVDAKLPSIDKRLAVFDCRNNRLLLAAYQQIASDVQQLIQQFGKDRIAVILGSSTSGISDGEHALKVRLESGVFPSRYHYKQQEMGSSSEFLAQYLGLTNLAFTVSTACSSSAKAFASARHFIEAGICDAALVGGADTLCRLTLNGFTALESVSASICNPFSRNRDGITIGEGAALFIVTKEKSAIELCGIGESSDAYHISAPHPEGAGAQAAMQMALMDAGLKPDQISYVNLHGTATVKNDQMESIAMQAVFPDGVACSSTKPLIGHTLGAAGATEIGLCWLALSDLNDKGLLPPHLWDGVLDTGIPQLALVKLGEHLLYVKGGCYLMSNSFAFGGSNLSVVIGRNPKAEALDSKITQS
jgi:3-oxoacyl-[acyl-carrier-protein] synthase-1